MGILSICSCCSCDTVAGEEFPRTNITRTPNSARSTALQPKVEPIDLVTVDEVAEIHDDEIVADETAGAEVSVEQRSPLSRISKRPLKDCRLKPGRRKITLTGAAAAAPPCSPEECVGDVPNVSSSKVSVGGGAYLVYSVEQKGSLCIQFTKEAPRSLSGILAYIKPATEFSPYHYTDDDGCKLVAENLQRSMQSEYTSDRKQFYEAWAKFLKLTTAANGTLYIMEASDLSPPPKVQVLLYKDGKIELAHKLRAINLLEYSVVGILPHSLDYASLSGDNYERIKFTHTCDEFGAVLIL